MFKTFQRIQRIKIKMSCPLYSVLVRSLSVLFGTRTFVIRFVSVDVRFVSVVVRWIVFAPGTSNARETDIPDVFRALNAWLTYEKRN